jgi:glycosyltransferase involved in cell wall biosynthesis
MPFLAPDLNESLRVLHILAPARQGGLESVVSMLSAGQRSEGTHVAAVLSPAEVRDHPFLARLETLGVPVTTVAVPTRSYVREYRSLKALIGLLRPHVVHTHGYHADVIAGAAGRSLGFRVVSTVHGFVGGTRRNWVYERMQIIALRRAAALLAVSAPLVERLAQRGISRKKIHLVPNGFAPAGPDLSRRAARRELGLPENALVVGWVGRLSREKGADVMLEAIAACEGPWRLSLIGDGPERNRLRQRAEDLGIAHRIWWHGSIANAGTLFSAFDAFVLSSRTEGTPIALFEAMNAGVPIVAAEVGGVPNVVTSVHALLVPPERPAMIAQSLAALLRDPAAAKQRSALAHERVVRQFGVGTWLAAVDAVYRAVENDAAKEGLDTAR